MKTILVDAVHSLVNLDGEIFQEMHVMLERFSNNKIILTSADYEIDNKYNLNHAPYRVFTLKHNPEKASPEYYQLMLGHLNLWVNEVVYFDHSKEAVESARSIGIHTYHYDKDAKDLGALGKFLTQNI